MYQVCFNCINCLTYVTTHFFRGEVIYPCSKLQKSDGKIVFVYNVNAGSDNEFIIQVKQKLKDNPISPIFWGEGVT